MTIGVSQGQQGLEVGKGIDIEPKIEVQGGGGFHMESGIRESLWGGGGGGPQEMRQRWVGPVWGRHPGETEAADGLRDGKTSYF